MVADSPIAIDGDSGFLGFASRMNPLNLEAGLLQESVNLRFDRGVAKVRKGAKRLAEGISPAGLPLALPFVLKPAPNEPVIRADYTGGIFASCVLRSPDAINSMEVVVLAGADRAYPIIFPGEFTSATWSGGELTTGTLENITDEVGNPLIISILPGELLYPEGETIESTDAVSMLQAFDRLYLLREADPAVSGWEEKSLSAGGISVSSTTATVNCSAHGYTIGDRIRLEGSSVAAFNGHEFDIVSLTANSFTITVPSGTASDTALTGRTVRRVKAPLYWDGAPTNKFFVRSVAGVPPEGASYRRLRSVGWANYVNNRFVIPDGRDAVSLSDVMDSNLYDPFWQNFRANSGSNDYLVGIHPWADGNVLIFMRRSIYLAEISQTFDSTNFESIINPILTRLTLLTDEIGCVARRSIVTAGNFVYFLSDAGVYRLDTKLDLKLRGDTLPLSDAIADQFENLNDDLGSNSCALWYGNRYYLACPINGSVADIAETNNTVFIFNSLNNSWETKDIYAFGIDNFLVATYGTIRRIFISNRAGALYLLDENEEGDESSEVGAGVTPVAARLRTRRYAFKTPHAKRFVRGFADVVLPDLSSITARAAIINPDSEFEVASLSNVSGTAEDYSLKFPIRAKAHAVEMVITSNKGRPEIRAASTEAILASSPQTETRTVS